LFILITIVRYFSDGICYSIIEKIIYRQTTMQVISHDNIFELISVDIDMAEEELKEKLMELGTNNFMDFLKNKELSMFSTPMLLGTEIKDQLGSVLINKNIPLDKYMETLLDRYIHDEFFMTTSFTIQTSNDVIKVYKDKATTRINNQLERTMHKQEKFKGFYKKVLSGEIKTKDQFDNFIHKVLSESNGITLMLKIIKNLDFFKDAFSQTANSTFLCLTIAAMYAESSKVTNHSEFMQKVACTSFFQNAGLLAGTVSNATNNNEKSQKAANIVAMLCRDDSIIEAVRNKYNYTDDDNNPVFKNINHKSNICMKILMTVNIFTDLINKNKLGPENIEVHKAMYDLAQHGYADPEIVKLLGQLFLPRLKYSLLEYAFKVQDQCNVKPIIWGVAGDMLPIKFICSKTDCLHTGMHKTLVPEDIKIVADEIYDTNVKSGVYHTCDHLTKRLQIYYKGLLKKMN
jgi:hypothetical protein